MALNPLQLEELREAEQLRAERETFQVTDVRSADWCMRKLGAIKTKRSEYEQYVADEIERLQEWLKAQCEELDRDAEFFAFHLTSWHAELLEQDPKNNKSVKLPHGVLKSRTTKSQPSKVDESEILAHVKATKETAYVKVVESVDWAEYKKTLSIVTINGQPVVVDNNGEIVPGVAIKVGGTQFSVEISD